ncbi:MAG: c-type cytochrome domain-containing protein, partial [Acidobacteriota bacterium]
MFRWCLFALTLSLLSSPLVGQSAEDGPAFFEKNIRPLFIAQCLGCHSATSQPIMGGLRLDTRDHTLKGGSRGPSGVPGPPTESLLLKVVRHTAGPLKMPPGPKMKDADAALLAQWIEMGAPWGNTAVSAAPAAAKKYWAFVPPASAPVPAPKNTAWPSSPGDRVVLAALEAKGLSPAPPAGKRPRLRRAPNHLTGRPPPPATGPGGRAPPTPG